MAQDAPRRRRARPVADAPVDDLLARGEEIAKGWMLALLEDAPLDAAPRILGDALTRDGPRLCDAAVRALAADAELARLAPGGPLHPLAGSVGAMTGGGGPLRCARAVDTLAEVLWAALDAELRAPAAELVTALAERLALVCALIRDAAIEGAAGQADAPSRAGDAPVGESPPDPAGGEPGESTEALWVSAPAPARAGAGALPVSGRPLRADADEPALQPRREGGSPAVSAASEPPLWMSAFADEVGDCVRDGRALSLLLAELEDAERVIASATPERAGAAFGDFVTALRSVLRGEDILVCEADARAWVIARGAPRAAAHSLGARIAEAVGQTSSLSGAPLVASVGIAVLGEDGTSCAALIEAAEEARFTASARGIEVSRRVPDQDR